MVDAAELNIDSDVTAQELADSIFGSGVTDVTATFSGDAIQSGIYSGGLATSEGVVPSDTGVILSTGNVADFTNSSGEANQNTNTSTDTDGGIDGDADFNAAANQATFDAAFIDATFTPQNETLTMQFVFSSEEYPEFVFSGFNDTFAVWVNGEQAQLSVAEGQTSVDGINTTNNLNLFVDNQNDDFNTEMDGFTVVLSLEAPVNVGEPNTLKIGVADAGDSVFDSNLLIAANSVQTTVVAADDSVLLRPDQSITVDLTANDTNSGAGDLTITHINGQEVFVDVPIVLATGETITLNEFGEVTILADSDLETNSFTYTVVNDDGVSDVGIVSMTTDVPCFTRGALVETDTGPRPVQDLMIGDLVVTRDAGLQPIRWIGSRKVDCDRPNLTPIRIAPGMFGAERRHIVSPLHRVLVRGWRAQTMFGSKEMLAAAKHLIDDRKVKRVDRKRIEYWHILLDEHQLLTVDGVASESFHPGRESLGALGEQVREEVLAIFPELRVAPNAYGPSSRPALKQFEAEIFAIA